MAQEKRVNYFQGMMLVDQDFKDDQYYHRQMRHDHNLELHTWGVVRGLEVSLDKTVVTVTEGLAIDASGKEIWWTGGPIQPAGSAADGSYLVVESAEEFRDTYPQMAGKYLRVIDTAKFSWKSAKGESDLVLAVLTQGQPDATVRRNASSMRVSGNSLELRPLSKDGSLRVMIGASERLTIAPSGNVGIGTTDPQARLHLKFPDVARGNAAVLNLEGTDHVYVQFFPLGFAAGRKAWMGYESANEKNFKIKNEYPDGHLLLASGSGKVGIGTSKPGFTLQVGDTDNVVDARLCIAGKGDTGNWRQWTLRTGDKVDATNDAAKTKEIHKLRIRDEQAGDRLVIDQDGNVGIGLTNPQNPLEVRGSVAIRSGILKFMDENGDWYQDNWIGMSSSVEGTLATKWLHIGGITDAGARRLALYADITYASGKVGIGTTNPKSILQIGNGAGGGKVTIFSDNGSAGQLQIGNPTAGAEATIGFLIGVAATDFGTNPTATNQWYLGAGAYGVGGNKFALGKAGQALVTMIDNGNLGIGTTQPNAKLEIQAGADSGGDYDQKAIALSYRSGGYRHWIRTRHNSTVGTGNAIDFYVNNATTAEGSSAPGTGSLHVMTLDTGRVGIGTTAPVAKLDIMQTARTGTHPTSLKCLYLSGDSDPAANGVEFRHTNGTQGIGFGYNTIYATGTNDDQDLRLQSRGRGNVVLNPNSGQVKANGDVNITGRISCGGWIAFKTFHGSYVTANDDKKTMRQNATRESWEQFTLEMACSREFKENISDLTAREAMATLQNLRPIKYDYKSARAFRQNLGFIAEEMPDNLASEDRKSVSPFEVIPVLTRVAKEQQQSIARLQETIRALQEEVRQNRVSTVPMTGPILDS